VSQNNIIRVQQGLLAFKRLSSTSALDPATASVNFSFSNSNLTATSSGGVGGVRSTTSKTTGKWYFEASLDTTGGSSIGFGVANASYSNTNFLGADADSLGAYNSQAILSNSSSVGDFGVPFTEGDVIGCAIDVDADRIWFKNATEPTGNWNNTGGANPAAGSEVGWISIGFITPIFAAIGSANSGGVSTINFGGTTFVMSPPSGYSAWG
jgi:hypothetical protein